MDLIRGDPRCSLRSPRFARNGWVELLCTQGRPRGFGQPWAWFFDPIGAVRMARCARLSLLTMRCVTNTMELRLGHCMGIELNLRWLLSATLFICPFCPPADDGYTMGVNLSTRNPHELAWSRFIELPRSLESWIAFYYSETAPPRFSYL